MIRLLALSATLITGVLVLTALTLPLMPLSTDIALAMLAFAQVPLLLIALGLLSWTISHHKRTLTRYRMATSSLPAREMARHARWMATRYVPNRAGLC